MLRGHFHAAADVVAAQLFQDGVAPLAAEQVVAKPATDEGMFNPRNLTDTPGTSAGCGRSRDRARNRFAG